MSEPVMMLATGDLVLVRVRDSSGLPQETVGIVTMILSYRWQGTGNDLSTPPHCWDATVITAHGVHDVMVSRRDIIKETEKEQVLAVAV